MGEESPTVPTLAMEGQKPNSFGKRPATHERTKLGKKRQNKKMRKRERDMKNGSTEEVLAFDIRDLRTSLLGTEVEGDESGETATVTADESLPAPGSEILLKVLELSSTGDALAVQDGSPSKQIYVLPFAVPGDIVKAKVYRHLRDEGYTVTDFISVVSPASIRDDARVRCGYFTKCSGCQFQMLDYADQLAHKKRIVERAFAHFSELPPDLIPAIADTIGSPLQYGYRTKLTPHFDGPPGPRRNKTATFTQRPDIGFMLKGKRTTLDIEDCPIGTEVVRLGMKSERERMDREFAKYKKGATILLRESTKRVPKNSASADSIAELESSSPDVKVESDTHVDWKTCVTDNNGTSTEYIGDYVFHNPAGSFFQNNNSILPIFTDYIRQHILPPASSTSTSTSTSNSSFSSSPPIKYLIDAYSGSGLFTITLSNLFQGSTGIDIAEQSIAFARTNATANNLPTSQANFIAADAGQLFKSVSYPANETVVVLDPPRKGCDEDFLNQLLRFAPRRVVYVSCNVHTQARDIGVLVRGSSGLDSNSNSNGDGDDGENGGNDGSNKRKGTRYAIESLRGFDFFPQTGHVEGVAVLNRVDNDAVAVGKGAE